MHAWQVLRALDGREVAVDERERADMMLSSDRASQQPSIHEQARSLGGKVPLKLTSLNFELMAGLPVADGSGLTAVGMGGAPHSAGPLGVGPSAGAPGAAWNPMSQGHDSFFLPAAKQVPLTRQAAAEAAALRKGSQASARTTNVTQTQWRMLDPRGQ